MMPSHAVRGWIWASLGLQGLGYLYDAVWHGLLDPGAEPQTTAAMARHLATVHLPLYVGAAAVLAATSRALLRRLDRSTAGLAVALAWVGALISVAGEAWHAASHLRLDVHSAPLAGGLSFVGFVVVLLTMSISAVTRRRRREPTARTRRAA